MALLFHTHEVGKFGVLSKMFLEASGWLKLRTNHKQLINRHEQVQSLLCTHTGGPTLWEGNKCIVSVCQLTPLRNCFRLIWTTWPNVSEGCIVYHSQVNPFEMSQFRSLQQMNHNQLIAWWEREPLQITGLCYNKEITERLFRRKEIWYLNDAVH